MGRLSFRAGRESVSVDDSLGWEVDAKASYKITKNLSYFVEAGYLPPAISIRISAQMMRMYSRLSTVCCSRSKRDS